MGYRWGEHVGELELCVEAPDERAVFAEAVRALGELLGGEHAEEPSLRWRVAAEASDRAGLFAAWLEELVFLAETERFVPVAAEEVGLEALRVGAYVRGHRGRPPHLVKAVTYHRLAFERHAGGWRAVAVLDV